MHSFRKEKGKTAPLPSQMPTYFFFLMPTYSVSVLAGNLGRISISKQEMVRLLHSVHLHTAGQESTVSDAPALARRLTSVNSAHVITCIAGWMASEIKTACTSPGCPSAVLPVGVQRDLRVRSRLRKWKIKKHLCGEFCWGQASAGSSQQEHRALWRLPTGAAEAQDVAGPVLDLEVVFSLRGGWNLGVAQCSPDIWKKKINK